MRMTPRVLNVVLTTAGTACAQAISEVIHALNRESGQRVNLAQLAAADSVLRAVITGDGALQSAASAISGPG
jgi:hypothetical protein